MAVELFVLLELYGTLDDAELVNGGLPTFLDLEKLIDGWAVGLIGLGSIIFGAERFGRRILTDFLSDLRVFFNIIKLCQVC